MATLRYLLVNIHQGRGAGVRLPSGSSHWGVRFLFVLLTSLACSRFSPAVPPAPAAVTPGPGAGRAALTASPPAGSAALAYIGQFDCSGFENGLRAYSGRVTVQPGGQVTFKDYDGAVQTGNWTYNPAANTFTFAGAIPFVSAVYNPAADSLVVAIVSNVTVAHAGNGTMDCQRAVPGQTGPP